MEVNFKDIKKYIKKHDRKIVAEKHNLSIAMVYAVGSGRRRNLEVLESLIQICEENKTKLTDLENRYKILKP